MLYLMLQLRRMRHIGIYLLISPSGATIPRNAEVEEKSLMQNGNDMMQSSTKISYQEFPHMNLCWIFYLCYLDKLLMIFLLSVHGWIWKKMVFFVMICTPADYNMQPLGAIYCNFIDALPMVHNPPSLLWIPPIILAGWRFLELNVLVTYTSLCCAGQVLLGE